MAPAHPPPLLVVLDDALSWGECARLQLLVEGLVEQSTPLEESNVGDELMQLAREYAGDLELIHTLGFAIQAHHSTELHYDRGEYAVIYYPHEAAAPLVLGRPIWTDIMVRPNRLVALDVTNVEHRQATPLTRRPRNSIVLKFRRWR